MFLGLFSSRWVVNGLGLSDFGLVGLVGGLLTFISFFNTVLGGSVGRYYSYVIGKHHIEPEDSCEELTQWFNTALCVHTVVPVVLMAVGAPVGYYAIGHWLVVPETRLNACYFVFTLSLLATFVSMVSIPYLSFFWSWQRFSEMVLWEIARTVVLFGFAYTLLAYDGDRMVYHAVYSACTMSVVTIVQMLRARRKFAPCRVRPEMWGDKTRLQELFAFSGWQLFGCAGGMLRNQGAAIVVNLFYGPKINGSFNVSNQLSTQTSALSNSLVTALIPAITAAEGGGSEDKVGKLAFRACKFGTLLVMFFAIPLALEIDEVLLLWLKQTPPFAADICRCVLGAFIIGKLTAGYMPAIMAKGKIAMYQVVTGGILLGTVPLVWLFAKAGLSPTSVGVAFVCISVGTMLSLLHFGWNLVGLSPRKWCLDIAAPLAVVGGLGFVAGFVVLKQMDQSPQRLLSVLISTTAVIGAAGWKLALNREERAWIMTNVFKRLKFRHILPKTPVKGEI
ncbi:MAG: oligosaccharide flippase family protein [Kiritimatiellae bacterium]|nr:oligosaccharide flippase family protein [Kiritimatiellia bacterium]